MSNKWLAVSLKAGNTTCRPENLLKFFRKRKIHILTIACTGKRIIMQLETSLSPADLERIAKKHTAVGATFAN